MWYLNEENFRLDQKNAFHQHRASFFETLLSNTKRPYCGIHKTIYKNGIHQPYDGNSFFKNIVTLEQHLDFSYGSSLFGVTNQRRKKGKEILGF